MKLSKAQQKAIDYLGEKEGRVIEWASIGGGSGFSIATLRALEVKGLIIKVRSFHEFAEYTKASGHETYHNQRYLVIEYKAA